MFLFRVMMNWKEIPPPKCEVWSGVQLTRESNSGAEIHCRL